MQTVVNDSPEIASPGDLADSADKEIVSAANEEASASIVVGTMVKQGTAFGLVKKLTNSHETPYGIVTRAHAFSDDQIGEVEVDTDVFYDGIKPDTMIGIGRRGRYAVLIEEDVAFDDAVHVRAVATTGEVAGAFGKTDGGADTILLGNASYCGDFAVDEDTGFGVAIVELRDGFDVLSTTDS